MSDELPELSNQAILDIDALLQKKMGASLDAPLLKGVNVRQEDGKVEIEAALDIDRYRPYLEDFLKGKGITPGTIEVKDGSGRSDSYRAETATLTEHDFSRLMQSLGAEKEYRKILDTPYAGEITLHKEKDSGLPSVNIAFASPQHAVKAASMLPKESGARVDGTNVLVAITREEASEEQLKKLERIPGVDETSFMPVRTRIEEALGEQSYRDEKFVRERQEERTRGGYQLERLENRTNSLKDERVRRSRGLDILAENPDVLSNDAAREAVPKLREAYDALKGKKADAPPQESFDALSRIYDLEKTVAGGLSLTKYEGPKEDLLHKAWETLHGIGEQGFKSDLEIVQKQLKGFKEAEGETQREINRAAQASEALDKIAAGGYGESLKSALKRVNETYGHASGTDTDRDGRADTPPQVLARTAEFASDSRFDALTKGENWPLNALDDLADQKKIPLRTPQNPPVPGTPVKRQL